MSSGEPVKQWNTNRAGSSVVSRRIGMKLGEGLATVDHDRLVDPAIGRGAR